MSAQDFNWDSFLSLPEVGPSCSAPECSLPIDIVLRSSDGVLLGAHAANLAQFAAGFPPAEFAQKSEDGAAAKEPEIVDLVETAEVLQLLLQYIHPQRQPNSKKWTFPLLASLAEAVEKYMVYSAMEVCKLRMEAYAMTTHSPQVLSYAVKHGYPDIRDRIIPNTLSWNLAVIQSTLQDPALIIAWVRYREQYLELSTALQSTSAESIPHGGGLAYSKTCIWGQVEDLAERAMKYPNCLEELQGFQKTFSAKISSLECSRCKDRGHNWERKINACYATIKRFASFV